MIFGFLRIPAAAGRDHIADLPRVLIERLQHYFLTYKLVPGAPASALIEKIYGRRHALKVVQASMDDYRERFR